MVDDRITDGKRIGQLLASELTGLERGPLAAVSVADADPDVTPSAAGARAYAVTHLDTRVGTVAVTPTAARLVLEGRHPLRSDRADISIETDEDRTVLEARSGAAVKTVVDLLVDVLEN